MTRDEILSMKPGRELDALVMQYIFKAEKKDIGDDCFWVSEIDGEEECWPRWFSPSIDISAAWEVLENMGGFTLVPAGRNIHGKISFWYAGKKYIEGDHVYEVNDARNPTTGCGETAPEAICKAALLAVMGEWR